MSTKKPTSTPQEQEMDAIIAAMHTKSEAVSELEPQSRMRQERPRRRKVYERVSETHIPQEIVDMFESDDYALRWVRWSINGEEDYRYLARRENEGYEFVQIDELPSSFLAGLKLMDTRNRKGLVTSGDVCLMKVDKDLKKSREDFYNRETDAEVAAVNIHNLTRKGFKDLGSKSSVNTKEPRFQ